MWIDRIWYIGVDVMKVKGSREFILVDRETAREHDGKLIFDCWTCSQPNTPAAEKMVCDRAFLSYRCRTVRWALVPPEWKKEFRKVVATFEPRSNPRANG